MSDYYKKNISTLKMIITKIEEDGCKDSELNMGIYRIVKNDKKNTSENKGEGRLIVNLQGLSDMTLKKIIALYNSCK